MKPFYCIDFHAMFKKSVEAVFITTSLFRTEKEMDMYAPLDGTSYLVFQVYPQLVVWGDNDDGLFSVPDDVLNFG